MLTDELLYQYVNCITGFGVRVCILSASPVD